MRTFFRFLVAFLAITGAVVLATGLFGIEFGRSNFWNHHGVIFLGCITFFPRLTLLLSSVPTGGILWWLSWLFAPRILVAVLATLTYWYENPILVILAWMVALGGESSEKYVVVQRSRTRWNDEPKRGRRRSPKWVDSEVD